MMKFPVANWGCKTKWSETEPELLKVSTWQSWTRAKGQAVKGVWGLRGPTHFRGQRCLFLPGIRRLQTVLRLSSDTVRSQEHTELISNTREIWKTWKKFKDFFRLPNGF